jgi:hypothetical protein
MIMFRPIMFGSRIEWVPSPPITPEDELSIVVLGIHPFSQLPADGTKSFRELLCFSAPQVGATAKKELEVIRAVRERDTDMFVITPLRLDTTDQVRMLVDQLGEAQGLPLEKKVGFWSLLLNNILPSTRLEPEQVIDRFTKITAEATAEGEKTLAVRQLFNEVLKKTHFKGSGLAFFSILKHS